MGRPKPGDHLWVVLPDAILPVVYGEDKAGELFTDPWDNDHHAAELVARGLVALTVNLEDALEKFVAARTPPGPWLLLDRVALVRCIALSGSTGVDLFSQEHELTDTTLVYFDLDQALDELSVPEGWE